MALAIEEFLCLALNPMLLEIQTCSDAKQDKSNQILIRIKTLINEL